MKSVRKAILCSIAILLTLLPDVHAGDWDAWKYHMPIILTNRAGADSGLIPIDVTFSIFADQCIDPSREIRLLHINDSGETEIPFQLSRLSRWERDTDGVKSRPTVNGRITFFDDAPGEGEADYFLLYGNPAAPVPDYPTDLTVTGESPAWTIGNDLMTVTLHSSGQIAAVRLASAPESPIAPATGILHWNPGVYVPTRTWSHAFAWNPPETCEIESGPLFVEIRRSGPFPEIPEVRLDVTYRFFRGRPYVESSETTNVCSTTTRSPTSHGANLPAKPSSTPFQPIIQLTPTVIFSGFLTPYRSFAFSIP